MTPRLAPLPVPRNRLTCIFLLGSTVLCGLGSRAFASEIPEIAAENAGDALWTVAVYLTFCLVFPSWSPLRIFALSIATSFLVEFSQLLDWQVLLSVRQTRFGRLLLGSGFLWVDLARYLVGGFAAFAIDLLLARKRSVDVDEAS